MWLYSILFLSLFAGSRCADNGTDCLAKEKSRGILDFAKESINKAKDLLPDCSDDFPSTNSSVCGKKEKAIAFLEIAKDLITEAENNYPTCPEKESKPVIIPTEKPVILPTEEPVIVTTEQPVILPKENPMDCNDVLRQGHNTSGVYDVWPKSPLLNKKSIKVYCDMVTDGGGWTVIQRRDAFSSTTQDFYQDWETYKKGFGVLEEEFWLGNENIYMISKQGNYQVRFDLEDFEGTKKHAVYKSFWIEDEAAKYKLHATGYSGTAGDAMAYDSGGVFCTKDRTHGMQLKNVPCTTLRGSGWWFKSCTAANINGLPRRDANVSDTKNMYWKNWKVYASLAKADMKIRRV